MYSTSIPPEAKIFTCSNPLRSSSQRTSCIRSRKSPRRLPGVSSLTAEIESGMARAAMREPNFSSSKVSTRIVRGICGSMTSSKAREASAAEPPGGELHRDPVAAAKVGSSLYHGCDRRVHPPRPEGDDRPLARGEPAAGSPRRHPRSLAQKAEDRRLVLGEGAVGTGEHQHRFVGAADRTLWHRPHLRPGSLQ